MSYIKPLRRKVGLFTLAVATLLMAGWVRSLFFYDCCILYPEPHSTYTMALHSRYLIVQYHYVNDFQNWPGSKRSIFSWSKQSNPDGFSSLHPVFNDVRVTWHFEHGIRVGEYVEEYNHGGRLLIVLIPCLPTATLLSLISAWLLLSKPRFFEPKHLIPTGQFQDDSKSPNSQIIGKA